jgi:hypothetical protein
MVLGGISQFFEHPGSVMMCVLPLHRTGSDPLTPARQSIIVGVYLIIFGLGASSSLPAFVDVARCCRRLYG